MTYTNISLLFIGWLIYWLSTAKLACKLPDCTPHKFAEGNYLDFIISFLNCCAIIITHDQLSFELFDLGKPETVLMAGFTSTTIINQFIKHFSNGSN